MQLLGRRRLAAGAAALAAAACGPLLLAGGAHAAAAAPAATPHAATTTIVAVTGTNRALYSSTNHGAYVNLGGAAVGAPALVSWDNRVYYFVRSTNNDIYVRTNTTGFSRVHVGAPLVCASSIGVSYELSEFVVGCVGTNGYLYSMSGLLPTSGNPATSVLVKHTAVPNLDTDSSLTKGGVGGETDTLALWATGPAYTIPDTSPQQYGNTYGFDAQTDPGDGIKGYTLCADAPEVVDAGNTAAYMLCHSPSNDTHNNDLLEYEDNASTNDVTAIDLGPALLGTPTGVEDGTSADADIYVTGTNDLVYDAQITSDLASSGFGKYPVTGTSNVGPGAVNLNPTSSRPSSRQGAHFAPKQR